MSLPKDLYPIIRAHIFTKNTKGFHKKIIPQDLGYQIRSQYNRKLMNKLAQ